jgi:hypothetical protein
MTTFPNIPLTGYRRENGRVGIRNHVIILSVDDISNAAVEGVASLIRGTRAISHPYGRLQFGEDLHLTFDTLIGAGRNPNVAAVVVIGIEPTWTDYVVKGIAETGKPVAGFSIERYGDLKTIEMASARPKNSSSTPPNSSAYRSSGRKSGSRPSVANPTPPAAWPPTRPSDASMSGSNPSAIPCSSAKPPK